VYVKAWERIDGAPGNSMRRLTFAILAAVTLASPALAKTHLVEPHMHIVPIGGVPEVALTLDACMGAADMRIIKALIDNGVPATIFATRRWLLHNPKVVHLLVSHADLFEIEDHGAEHIPAVIGSEKPYGIAPAGTANAVFNEVLGGAQAVQAATGVAPHWYRGATALYSKDAMSLVATMGYRIGGFSLNGDIGASASEKTTETRIASARSGDVIISHVNQPTRPAGAGVVAGILALKAKGFKFVRLEDVTETDD
jgi:peptidoglycan/xylan/chitin deacetylase (PgdA/CDA1 family)